MSEQPEAQLRHGGMTWRAVASVPARTPRITKPTPQNTPSLRITSISGSKKMVIISLKAMENSGKMEPLTMAARKEMTTQPHWGFVSRKMRMTDVSTSGSASGAT